VSKTKISEYSTTPSNNTDIDGVNIAEGCPPSGINNAIRTLMTHVKEWQNGESGDSTTFSNLNVVNTISASVVTANTFISGGVNILQALYPVGSIYMNATNATNPGTLLGFGTWTAFGAGRVPVGFDSGNSNFNAAEKTGGSADAVVVSHTHTATVTDPGHRHNLTRDDGVTEITGGKTNIFAWNGRVMGSIDASGGTLKTNLVNTGIGVTNASTGSSGTNANLQPYITCYMWKRTA
jgi:hypothetical protein